MRGSQKRPVIVVAAKIKTQNCEEIIHWPEISPTICMRSGSTTGVNGAHHHHAYTSILCFHYSNPIANLWEHIHSQKKMLNQCGVSTYTDILAFST